MKTRFNTYILIVISCVTFSSCEVDVTNDLTIETAAPKLIIEGGLERNLKNPLGRQRIRLTTTRDFLNNDTQTPLVEDAVVTVSDGNTSYVFSYAGDGFYENTEIAPVVNGEYTLKIIWNEEEYEATETLNEVPLFDAIYSVFEEETLVTDEGYFAKFDSTDPAGIANFYYHRIARNGEFIVVPDPGNSDVLVISDEFFDGQQRIGVNPNDEIIFEIGDEAIVQQLGISERYYDYLYEVFVQSSAGGFSFVGNPPPESIRGNMKNLTNSANRPLGFFYAADVEEARLIITE